VEPLGREPNVHRIAVIDRESQQLYNLVTQSMVLRFIHDHIEIIGTIKVMLMTTMIRESTKLIVMIGD
jgi:hypothetical protein